MGIADVVGSIGSTATGVADKAKSISEVGNLKRKIAYEEERIVEIFADNMEMLTPRGTSQSQTPSVSVQQSVQQTVAENMSDDLPF